MSVKILLFVMGLLALVTTIYAFVSTIGYDARETTIYTGNRDIVRLDNDTLIAIYVNETGGLICSQSNDFGVTWFNISEIVKTASAPTVVYPSLATNGSDIMVVAFESAEGDLGVFYSKNGCQGLKNQTIQDITGLTTAVGMASLGYNGLTKQWVMCLEYTDDDVGFANVSTAQNYSTNWRIVEAKNTANIGNGCAITVREDGKEVLFVTADASNNDLDLYNSSAYDLTTWTETLVADWNPTNVDINQRGNIVAIVSERNADDDLYVFYNTSQYSTWSENEYNITLNENMNTPTVCVDSYNIIHIVVQNDTGSKLATINFTPNWGWGSWMYLYNATGLNHHSQRCTNYPVNNKKDDGVIEVTLNQIYNPLHGLFFQLYIRQAREQGVVWEDGDWQIDCTKNYTIKYKSEGTKDRAVSFIGKGKTNLLANITGFRNYTLSGGCVVNCTSKGCLY